MNIDVLISAERLNQIKTHRKDVTPVIRYLNRKLLQYKKDGKLFYPWNVDSDNIEEETLSIILNKLVKFGYHVREFEVLPNVTRFEIYWDKGLFIERVHSRDSPPLKEYSSTLDQVFGDDEGDEGEEDGVESQEIIDDELKASNEIDWETALRNFKNTIGYTKN